MSYLLGSAAIVGLPLGLTVLLVIVGHIAGNAVGNEGFPVVVIVLGFVFLFGLFFSVPVFLIVVGIVVVLQKQILNHLLGWAVVSPFVVTVIFIASSYWFGLHPASSHVNWLTYVQHPQIWAYSTYAFAWSAVAAVPFYFFGQEIDVAVAKRGALTRVKTEAKIHSGAKPEFYRIYKFEQATDVGTKQRDGRRPRNQVYYQGERAKARALDHPRVGRHPPL